MTAKTTSPNSTEWHNPCATDGFEFVEYSSPEPARLAALFEQLGFVAIARHRAKNVTLYRQGDINFILNAEPGGQPAAFRGEHGPSANAVAFRVADAAAALDTLTAAGAEPVASGAGPMELAIPAIRGIGGSLIYLVDRYGEQSIYDVDFRALPGVELAPKGAGLVRLDHLTHNVERGRMDHWAGFYERLFNFRELRYFDVKGKLTGLHSRAMTGPCGKLRIPINESADDHSQIAEYLREHNGEGIQHIALASDDIYATVEALRARGVEFLDTPDTYYEALERRVPGHGEPLARLQDNRILVDGEPLDRTLDPTLDPNNGSEPELLLQIFTRTVIGPLFFEIIQRKGNEGFGEGNFKALFDSIEEDQLRRGTLKAN